MRAPAPVCVAIHVGVAVLLLGLGACYCPLRYEGDGYVVSNWGHLHEPPYTIWLPEMNLAQSGEHRLRLGHPPPRQSWIELQVPHTRDALARLTAAGTSIDVMLLDTGGSIVFTGGGLIPDDQARPSTTPPGWVCNGGDPYAMWTLPGLPRFDTTATYCLVVRVNVEHPSSDPLMCPLRVNLHSD